MTSWWLPFNDSCHLLQRVYQGLKKPCTYRTTLNCAYHKQKDQKSRISHSMLATLPFKMNWLLTISKNSQNNFTGSRMHCFPYPYHPQPTPPPPPPLPPQSPSIVHMYNANIFDHIILLRLNNKVLHNHKPIFQIIFVCYSLIKFFK